MPVCGKVSFSLGGRTPWRPPTVEKCTRRTSAGSDFWKISSLALAGARRGGHRRWRSVLAERQRKAFLEKEFFSLGRRTPWRPPTVEKCTRRTSAGRDLTVLFCREQKSTKRVAPEGANLRFAPSGLPHSRGDALWGRAHPCRSLHPAERRLSGSELRPRSYSPVCAPE